MNLSIPKYILIEDKIVQDLLITVNQFNESINSFYKLLRLVLGISAKLKRQTDRIKSKQTR